MSIADQPALGFVGAGKAGSALAVALSTAGYPVTSVSSRTPGHAETVARHTGATICASPADAAKLSEVLFLTVPDGAVREVAAEIARSGGFRAGGAVVHVSGVLPLDVLQEAGSSETLTGIFHPLQALAGVGSSPLLQRAYVGIEADPDLLPVLRTMVRDLQATPLHLSGVSRAPYHLAAVLAANYPLALLAAASDLMREAGVADECSLNALLPLAHGSLLNLSSRGFPAGLTGPAARGDDATVRQHMEYLRVHRPELLEAYRAVGLLLLNALPEEQANTLVRQELES